MLRRIAVRGLSGDQVEIVASDPAAYGSALHAMGACMGIPVTYAVGLPVVDYKTGMARDYRSGTASTPRPPGEA